MDITPRSPLLLNFIWFLIGFFTPILFVLLFVTVHYA